MGDDNGGREQPAASSSGSGAPTADLVAAVQARLAALGAPRGGDAPGAPAAQQLLFDRASKTQRKARYAFWETQPVVQFDAAAAAPQVRRERAAPVRAAGCPCRGGRRSCVLAHARAWECCLCTAGLQRAHVDRASARCPVNVHCAATCAACAPRARPHTVHSAARPRPCRGTGPSTSPRQWRTSRRSRTRCPTGGAPHGAALAALRAANGSCHPRPAPSPPPKKNPAPSFAWSDCDISDAKEVQEVYELLSLNYVEDDDAMFRWEPLGAARRQVPVPGATPAEHLAHPTAQSISHPPHASSLLVFPRPPPLHAQV